MTEIKSHTDERLLSLLRQGNHDAFKEIYNRYWLVIYRRFYKKFQSKELAEEYTQELFTSIWFRRNDLSINSSIILYLNGAVRKMVINYIRNEIRKKLVFNRSLDEEGSFSTTPENQEENEYLLVKLQAAIENLPDKTGKIIRLSKLHGLSVKEIANNQNLSNKAVEYHITKALKTLKAYFKDLKNAAASLL
ncbi:MAG TPA: sigma-70 family RNA polymerase sigma factor [Chryseolinea sp.]|nr:sigma-70 family RNA polymerase sigma factor [Chryseolinea sp.]